MQVRFDLVVPVPNNVYVIQANIRQPIDNSSMTIFSIIVVVYAISMFISIAVLFDNIIKIEYKKYHQAWINDKKPRGYFWQAPDTEYLAGIASRDKMAFVMLFKTPLWLRDEINGIRMLFLYRTLCFSFILSLSLAILVILKVKGLV